MRSTLCLALASICVSFPFAAHSQTTSGSIWGSETWDSTMNPILVTGDVTIEEGATLTIEAGTEVRFEPSDDTEYGWDFDRCEIIVYGTLNILGTDENLVVLTGRDTAAMGWFGIIFSDVNATGTVQYCNIDRSVYGINFTSCAGGANAPAVSNCLINDVAVGMYFDSDSAPAITDCTVVNASIGFECWDVSAPVITNCNVSGLVPGAEGAGRSVYATERCTPVFTGCAFASGPVDIDCWADVSLTDTTVARTASGVVGYETRKFEQSKVPSYCKATLDNCNIIGLGDRGNGIEWDDNLDVIKVQFSRIGGFTNNVWARWGTIDLEAGIYHPVGVTALEPVTGECDDGGSNYLIDDSVDFYGIGAEPGIEVFKYPDTVTPVGVITAIGSIPSYPVTNNALFFSEDPPLNWMEEDLYYFWPNPDFDNIDLGDPDASGYWPPTYSAPYSAGENEFYGVQNPSTDFNIRMEQGSNKPPSLYQLDIWAVNNWWATTDDNVVSRYIWDRSENGYLGRATWNPHRDPDKRRTYSVSGIVVDNLNEAVEGVRVEVDISAQFAGHTVLADITDEEGYYTIYGLPPNAIEYNVTPTKLGYTFDPAAIPVSIPVADPSDVVDQDFDATLPAPRITSVGRADGLDGDAHGLPGRTNWGLASETTDIVINGLNFRDGATVYLRGPLPGADDIPCSNVVWVTGTRLTATLPAGLAVGDYVVRVVNPDTQEAVWGDTDNPGFTIVPPPPPHVSEIVPAEINSFESVDLTITGSDFITGCSVAIGGTLWSSLSVLDDGGRIVVHYSPGTLAPGRWPVRVTNPDGQTSNENVTLAVNGPPAPADIQIDPDRGPNNKVVDVIITGLNFVATPSVRIGTTFCLNVALIDAGRLEAQVPTGITPGTYDVVVTNPDGGTGTLPNGYTVEEPPLAVHGVSPPMGKDDAETDIIVVGENFKTDPNIPTVKIGDAPGTECTNVRVVSSTCILATVPAMMPGLYNLIVDNADGEQATLENGYTVVGVPTLSSGGPTSGAANKTTPLTVHGANFVYIPKVEILTDPPTRCTDVRFVSSAQLEANVPSGIEPGTYGIRVTNPLEKAGELPAAYEVTAPPVNEPTVTGVNPARGSNGAATEVTITGSGFTDVMGTVTLDTVPPTVCTPLTWTDTQITATVPAGLRVGSYDVAVTNATGTGALTHGFTAGGSGTLPAGQTTLAGTVLLTGDLVVPAGSTLTVEPGSMLRFEALSDDTSGNWDGSRGEIKVSGRLEILGEETARAALTSNGGAASDWLGVILSDTTASVWIEHADFTNAVYGLAFESNLAVPAADDPRPWVHDIYVANCATGVALNSSKAFTCPAIDGCTIDTVETGITARSTAAPIFTTVLFRNVAGTGLEGRENAIVTLEGSSIVDAPKAISCPAKGTGEQANASTVNLVFSVLGNGAVELSDSSRLTARMVTHLLFPDTELAAGLRGEKAAVARFDYSNVVQGDPMGVGIDWGSAGDCALSYSVIHDWGVGVKREGDCGAVDLGGDVSPGWNEFLGVMNPEFNVWNDCADEMTAQNNWWLTTDETVIGNHLYDGLDDPELGLIDYAGFLAAPRTYSVSGTILDSSETGVDRVQVVAEYATPHTDNDRMAMTDENGRYTIFGLLPGDYTVRFEKQGYRFEPDSFPVSIDLTNPTDINGQDTVADVAPPAVYGIRRTDGVAKAPYGTQWAYRPMATEVTITGLNFRPGATAALVGPLPAEAPNNLPVLTVGATTITASVPAGFALGGYGVRVTNPDTQAADFGLDEASPAFTIIDPPAPVVSAISPALPTKDYDGLFVITGLNFFGVPEVHFGDVTGYYNLEYPNFDPAPTSTTIWIRIAPEDLLSLCDQGEQPVQVFNPDGQGSNTDIILTVNGPPPPTVTSVTPASEESNKVCTITIDGSAFVETPSVYLVNPDTGVATDCLNETFVSTSRITADVPTGLDPRAYTVRVCNPPCSPGAPIRCGE